MVLVLIILLVLLAVGAFSNVGTIPHDYGGYPSGIITLIVIILVILLLTGRL